MKEDLLQNSSAIKEAKILIVDDMEFNIVMLKHLLSKNGFNNIVIARNASEAIEITRIEVPNLVILDLMMPETNGFEYCNTIRKEERFTNLPIIIQTAVHSGNGSIQLVKAFNYGVIDFMSKPVDPKELIAGVIRNLENRILLQKLQNY